MGQFLHNLVSRHVIPIFANQGSWCANCNKIVEAWNIVYWTFRNLLILNDDVGRFKIINDVSIFYFSWIACVLCLSTLKRTKMHTRPFVKRTGHNVLFRPVNLSYMYIVFLMTTRKVIYNKRKKYHKLITLPIMLF